MDPRLLSARLIDKKSNLLDKINIIRCVITSRLEKIQRNTRECFINCTMSNQRKNEILNDLFDLSDSRYDQAEIP